MKFVECELHSPTKMSKLIGLASLESPLHIRVVSTLYRVYICLHRANYNADSCLSFWAGKT